MLRSNHTGHAAARTLWAASLTATLSLVGTTCRFDRSGVGAGGPFCGNGIREGDEVCDGYDTAGLECVDLPNYSFSGGTLRCDHECDGYDLTECIINTCGDGILLFPEECDGQDLNGMNCVDLDEGFTGGTLGCGPLCRFDRTGCVNFPNCGNGVRDPGETCDGLDLASETCDSLGLGLGTLLCLADCSDFDTSGCSGGQVCSNGVREGNEVCDGGDVPQTCVGLGFSGGTLTCLPDCTGYDTSTCIQPDGGPCQDPADCDGDTCFQENIYGWPGGYCTRTCTPNNCPSGEQCEFFEDAGQHYCVKTCSQTSDCREGYICMDLWNLGETLCWPFCWDDAQCTTAASCDRWVGRCGSVSTGAENGQGCLMDDSCKGGICHEQWPGGYCMSLCSLSLQTCPGDGQCSDVLSGNTGDAGACLDGCTQAPDCTRTGYECYTNQDGPGMVCRPY